MAPEVGTDATATKPVEAASIEELEAFMGCFPSFGDEGIDDNVMFFI